MACHVHAGEHMTRGVIRLQRLLRGWSPREPSTGPRGAYCRRALGKQESYLCARHATPSHTSVHAAERRLHTESKQRRMQCARAASSAAASTPPSSLSSPSPSPSLSIPPSSPPSVSPASLPPPPRPDASSATRRKQHQHHEPEHYDLLLTTRDMVEGHDIVEDLGTISAAHVGSKNLLVDIYAALKGALGGEVRPYSDLVNDTRDAAVLKLLEVAKDIDASAVVRVRFEQALAMNRLVFGMQCSVMVYGTAVRCVPRAYPIAVAARAQSTHTHHVHAHTQHVHPRTHHVHAHTRVGGVSEGRGEGVRAGEADAGFADGVGGVETGVSPTEGHTHATRYSASQLSGDGSKGVGGGGGGTESNENRRNGPKD